MAKKTAEVQETAAAPAKGRKVMLTDLTTGEEIARADFIKQEYAANGGNRSAIVKLLKERFGHEVPYQIVFAATKPAKADKAEGEAEGEAAAE